MFTPTEKFAAQTSPVFAAATASRAPAICSNHPVVPTTVFTPSAASRRTFSGAAPGLLNSTATSTPHKLSSESPLPPALSFPENFASTTNPYSGASCSINFPILPHPTMASPLLKRAPLRSPEAAVSSAHKSLLPQPIVFSECALPSCAPHECCPDQSKTA